MTLASPNFVFAPLHCEGVQPEVDSFGFVEQQGVDLVPSRVEAVLIQFKACLLPFAQHDFWEKEGLIPAKRNKQQRRILLVADIF